MHEIRLLFLPLFPTKYLLGSSFSFFSFFSVPQDTNTNFQPRAYVAAVSGQSTRVYRSYATRGRKIEMQNGVSFSPAFSQLLFRPAPVPLLSRSRETKRDALHVNWNERSVCGSRAAWVEHGEGLDGAGSDSPPLPEYLIFFSPLSPGSVNNYPPPPPLLIGTKRCLPATVREQ